MKTEQINTIINGEEYELTVPAHRTLLELLRNDLHLTGAKEGCNEGECGACTVLIDGKPMNACLILAVEVSGKQVLTVEGLQQNGQLHPIQEAFAELGAVQCGYCIPGTLLSAVSLLERYPNPTEEEIRRGIEGNICRCAGYPRIVEAIKAAAATMAGSSEEKGE